jgi:hypothetical protein
MTTEQIKPDTDSTAGQSTKRRLITAAWVVVALAVLCVIAYNARMGAVSDRIRNPAACPASRSCTLRGSRNRL